MPTISSRGPLLAAAGGRAADEDIAGSEVLLPPGAETPVLDWPVDEDCEAGADLQRGTRPRGRRNCRKSAMVLTASLVLAAVITWAARGLSAPVAHLENGLDPAIVGEQLAGQVFDCDAGVTDDRWKRAWSTAKMIYCCSHYRKGCPGYDEAAVAFVFSNIRYTDLIGSQTVFGSLKDAVKEAIVTVVGAPSTKDGIDLLYWESSGIFSTVPDQSAVGIVFKCIVHIPPPSKVDDAISKLNQTSLLKQQLEKAAASVDFGALAPGEPQVKSIIVEPKIVDQCTCRNGVPQQDDLCPTFGGEVCKSCDIGYTMTDGNFCIENKCYCTDGFGAEGSACPKDGALWCASCYRGFGLVQDMDAKERVCVGNSCYCMNGTAAVGPACGQNKALLCSECDTGFHLNVNLTCEENTCQCPEGIPVTGAKCTEEGATICDSCDKGFHVDEHGRCSRNVCECENGQVALGELCHTDKSQVCAYCYSTFHLRKDGSCGEKECLCPHGTAKSENDCRTHHSIACEECDPGYHINNGQCIATGCMCENGIAASHSECAQSGDHKCAECHIGYTLNPTTKLCEANVCECGNGTAAVGATCRATGTMSCTECNPGFHIALENIEASSGATVLRVGCEPNKCVCPNGVPANETSGTLCHTDGGQVCQACDKGYHFETTKDSAGQVTGHACAINQCKCHHGVAVESAYCAMDGAENCSACDTGYFPIDEPMTEFEPGSGHSPPKKEEFLGDNTVCAARSLTTSLPFDCNSALANWESAWSRLKKRWCCATRKLGCQPRETQSEMCENKGYDLAQCTMIGCCRFDPRTKTCTHATGDGSSVCHPEYTIKTSGGQCVTAAEHHYGAVTKRTLSIERCDSSNTGQDWAPSSKGHGLNQIEDVGGLCFTVDDQVGGKVTADACSMSTEPNEITAIQTISFVPLPGHPNVGFLRTKKSFCLTAMGAELEVAQCNPMDENQQFTTSPASVSMVGGGPLQ